MPTVTADAPAAPDRPLGVALIAPPWLTIPPNGYGGTEEAVDGLARGLVAAGRDVVLAAREDSGCPVPRWAPVPAIGHDIGTREDEVGHVARAYRELPSVDVVHDHTMTGASMPRRRSSTTGSPAAGRLARRSGGGDLLVRRALARRLPRRRHRAVSRTRMVADHVELYRRLVVASVEERVGAGAGRSARPRTQGQRAV